MYIYMHIKELSETYTSIFCCSKIKQLARMAELQIARSMADVLHRLRHSGDRGDDDVDKDVCGYDRRRWRRGVPAKLGQEGLDLARLSGMTAEVALSRARETNRDFNAVMAETELKVSMELARILAATVDPVLEGLRRVAAVEAEVCGVCQEEMEVGDDIRAMGCNHKFHAYCVFKWLHTNNSCPLCRYQM